MGDEISTASDGELLRLSPTQAEAFAVFYRRHERMVVGWLMRQTRDAELTADLTAEVFAAAYLGAERFREGPEPAGAWLLGIARNKLLGSWRKHRTESEARRRLGVEGKHVVRAVESDLEDGSWERRHGHLRGTVASDPPPGATSVRWDP